MYVWDLVNNRVLWDAGLSIPTYDLINGLVSTRTERASPLADSPATGSRPSSTPQAAVRKDDGAADD